MGQAARSNRPPVELGLLRRCAAPKKLRIRVARTNLFVRVRPERERHAQVALGRGDLVMHDDLVGARQVDQVDHPLALTFAVTREHEGLPEYAIHAVACDAEAMVGIGARQEVRIVEEFGKSRGVAESLSEGLR